MTDDPDDHDADDDRLDLGAWTAPPPPADLTARVLDQVRAGGAVGAVEPVPPRPRRWPALVAAGGLLAAAAGVVYVLRPPTERPASGHVVAAAPSTVALADGSEALLATGAELTWRRDRAGIAVAQAAGAVTYRHRGSPLVVTTPGGVVRTHAASFHVEVPMKKQLIVGAAGAAAVAVVLVAVYDGRADVEAPPGSTRVVEAGGQVALAVPSSRRAPGRVVPVARATKDRARREEVAAAIASARAARPAGGAGAGPGPDPADQTVGTAMRATPGPLTKDEIRAGVKEAVPLLTECYELALETDPHLRGQVVANLHVDSEPDIGMVVTMAGIDTTLSSRGKPGGVAPTRDFEDCFTATMESIVLPPLPEGGHVEINYPFRFQPVSDDEGEDDTEDAAPSADPFAAVPAHELVVQAEKAAKESLWPQALLLAEATLGKQPDATTRLRATTAAALAACNLKHARKAALHYADIPPNRQLIIRQRCLQLGITL